VLLFAWCGAGKRVPLERVIAQRNWGGLRAVRDRRVHCIQDEYLNTPAPTLLEGLACIATAVHPALHGAGQRAAMLCLPVSDREREPNECLSL
jgi:iron complex transport system substrate-binding protein